MQLASSQVTLIFLIDWVNLIISIAIWQHKLLLSDATNQCGMRNIYYANTLILNANSLAPIDAQLQGEDPH